MKDYYKNKGPFYFKYWDSSELYGQALFQKLQENNFEQIEDSFQFKEDFIKNYNE